jgi:hypothetical protein
MHVTVATLISYFMCIEASKVQWNAGCVREVMEVVRSVYDGVRLILLCSLLILARQTEGDPRHVPTNSHGLLFPPYQLRCQYLPAFY